MSLDTLAKQRIGVVVIGRNEGDRLRVGLEAVAAFGCPMVYVDSGSTDQSVEIARDHGAHVLELDTSIPFTAARARNVGWRYLVRVQPQIEHLQFFDGDCIAFEPWLAAAFSELTPSESLAAVCGRRREQHRDLTVFNTLCDIEWDGPLGDIDEFGGGVMIRRAALEEVDGYNDSVIAAEDTELSVRLRKAGWSLRRIAVDMEEHDAKMTQVGQWWRRAVRSGHAHAEMAHRHGEPPYECRVRNTRSCLIWGLVVPVMALGLAWPTHGLSLLLFGLHVALYLRMWRRLTPALGAGDAHLFAFWTLLSKLPEAIGALTFLANRWRGRQAAIIEYKPVPPTNTTVQA